MDLRPFTLSQREATNAHVPDPGKAVEVNPIQISRSINVVGQDGPLSSSKSEEVQAQSDEGPKAANSSATDNVLVSESDSSETTDPQIQDPQLKSESPVDPADAEKVQSDPMDLPF